MERREYYDINAMRTLSLKQQAVLDFIQRYLKTHRTSPLIREIQAGCQIASYKSAVDRLIALERKGFIKRAQNKHRGIRIVRQAHEPTVKKEDAPAFQGAS